MASHTLLLAATTALDKIEKVPPSVWAKLGGCVLGVILVVIIFRKILKINKFVLGGVLFITGGILWFNWIYHRTEPAFLTPLINRIAPFFPSAGAYEVKQTTTPDAGKK